MEVWVNNISFSRGDVKGLHDWASLKAHLNLYNSDCKSQKDALLFLKILLKQMSQSLSLSLFAILAEASGSSEKSHIAHHTNYNVDLLCQEPYLPLSGKLKFAVSASISNHFRLHQKV